VRDISGNRNPPRRKRNAEVRAPEYLTDGEIARLIDAGGKTRYGHRDATTVLVAYRHGLRAAELVTLRWHAIDFAHGRLRYPVASGLFWATATSSTQCATPSWRRPASRTSGTIDRSR
jgi:integrase